ncbi:MAG: hypothetical protein VX589_06240 [Myxococcota bacterium]|nr:hypothetical protein [Myxococcota bacterium]
MKTKAYKLAAELGLKEQSVLDWLRANGYPNVRRADMIRADVAQAARAALGRDKRPLPATTPGYAVNRGRSSQPRREVAKNKRLRDGGARHENQRSGQPPANDRGPFKMSFAELLEGHLPGDPSGSSSDVRTLGSKDNTLLQTVEMVSPLREPQEVTTPDVRALLSQQEIDRLKGAVQVKDAKVAGLERLLNQANVELEQLKRTHEQAAARQRNADELSTENLTLKERIKTEIEQREALEQTCSELQSEIADLQGMVGEIDSLQFDHDSVLGDLENARQREVAWRKRALELERAAHAGDDLHGLLKAYGLETGRQQLRVLQAILGNERLSGHLIKSIRHVDASVIRKIIDEQVLPACVHPVCRQVVASRGRTPFRVDDDTECAICAGSVNRRWYAKLTDECERAGLKRLLMVGGDDDVQDRLRGLSEGRVIDFRLVARSEDTNRARIRGRIEGCDALIGWVDPNLRCISTDAYIDEARAQNKLVVEILGCKADVPHVARAVSRAAARNHLLQAH